MKLIRYWSGVILLISTTNFPENKLNVALVVAGAEGHAGVLVKKM